MITSYFNFHQKLRICIGMLLLLWGSVLTAAETDAVVSTQSILCESNGSERQHCIANTESGVVLVKPTGSTACLLGRNWGYDNKGIWVMEGCGGEFLTVGGEQTPASVASEQPVASESETQVVQKEASVPPEHRETWGVLDPGNGFLIGRSEHGDFNRF